ncbi:MAG: hypothetical protein LWW92_04040 [Rhodocyclales bacterium]|nr:hypothetical protein [Rhodocyclales bacterium]
MKYLGLSVLIPLITPTAHADQKIAEGVYMPDLSGTTLKDGGKIDRIVESIKHNGSSPPETGIFDKTFIVKSGGVTVYTTADNILNEKYESLSITAPVNIATDANGRFLLSYEVDAYYPNYIKIGVPPTRKAIKLRSPQRIEIKGEITKEGDLQFKECAATERIDGKWVKSWDPLAQCAQPWHKFFNVTQHLQGRKEWAHLF